MKKIKALVENFVDTYGNRVLGNMIKLVDIKSSKNSCSSDIAITNTTEFIELYKEITKYMYDYVKQKYSVKILDPILDYIDPTKINIVIQASGFFNLNEEIFTDSISHRDTNLAIVGISIKEVSNPRVVNKYVVKIHLYKYLE